MSATGPTTARTIPSPLLRKAAILSFLPAFPLCVAHGALSRDLVPAIGLVPLFFSAAVSVALLSLLSSSSSAAAAWSSRRRRGKQRETELDPEAAAAASFGGGGQEPGDEEAEAAAGRGEEGISGVGDGVGDEDQDGESRSEESVLTHRILVFVADIGLAAALMVVLVFTWIGTKRTGESAELAMLAAYATIPLLVNFLIHLYLAAREFVAGLAVPGLIEWTAWRAVPADCPHCGSRLRPDSLPPIPWYDSVSAPNVTYPVIKAPSLQMPSLPALKFPRFSGLRRDWKIPNWMRGQSHDEYARLFVDNEHNERDGYRDDPEGGFGEPSASTIVAATGSADPVPEEVVVGKKDRKRKSGSPALFAEDEASWP